MKFHLLNASSRQINSTENLRHVLIHTQHSNEHFHCFIFVRIFRYRKTKIEEEKEDMLPGATIKSPTDMPAGLVASALPSELPLVCYIY